MEPLFAAIEEMAAATCEALGAERIAWLRGLPRVQICGPMSLVHASPKSTWEAPMPEDSDDELGAVYRELGRPIAMYAHIHRSFIRNVSGMMVVNTGSVSLSYDSDPRASYLLLDDSEPTIRRVEYDVDSEVRALSACGLPHADWIAKILRAACFQMP